MKISNQADYGPETDKPQERTMEEETIWVPIGYIEGYLVL